MIGKIVFESKGYLIKKSILGDGSDMYIVIKKGFLGYYSIETLPSYNKAYEFIQSKTYLPDL
jgi:hypothetical protein